MDIRANLGISNPVRVENQNPSGDATPQLAERTQAGSAVPIETKVFTKKELEATVQSLNQLMGTSFSHVKFKLHEDLNEYYVQVVNDNTNEVIREIPSKRLMDSIAKMYEFIGLMVDEKV